MFDLPKSHFFRFLQIRHFVQKSFASFADLPTDNIMNQILSLSPDRKKLTSSLYDTLFNISSPSLEEVWSWWETDMGEKFREECF